MSRERINHVEKPLYPPGTQKHKGSIALWLLAALLVMSILSVSLATLAQATLSTGSSSKIALQAQQYAEAEAALVRATRYNELAAHERTIIDNSLYESEIQISNETETADNIKQKTVSILVYRSNENAPRYTLKVPRLEVEASSGVPVGTIITWASSTNPSEGVWLECNGQSCSKYPQLVAVLGSNKVPDYRGRFLEGNTTPGTKKEAGLPNITGSFIAVFNGNPVSGAFYNDGKRGHTKQYTDWDGQSIRLDASRSNPIYGRSDTVQPASVTVRYLIKAE